MRTRKIKSLVAKANKEAQFALNKIYEKYSLEVNREIASQIPIGHTLLSYNGLCYIKDENDSIVKGSDGNAWSRTSEPNPPMDYLAGLQYGESGLLAGVTLDEEIKGTKK